MTEEEFVMIFVAGAKWWEWNRPGEDGKPLTATMFPSDRDAAVERAEAIYRKICNADLSEPGAPTLTAIRRELGGCFLPEDLI